MSAEKDKFYLFQWVGVGLVYLLFLLPLPGQARSEQGGGDKLVVKMGIDHTHRDSFQQLKENIFRCVLSEVETQILYRRRPLARHRKDLGVPPYDIAFPVASSYVLKPGEELSKPLALEEWYWLMHAKVDEKAERPDLSKLKVAVIQGSEEEEWLLTLNVPNLSRVVNIDQLVKLFSRERVDVLLIDRDTLKDLALEMGVDLTRYHFKFERFVSFSALFSAALKVKHPQIIQKFNKAIPNCSTETELLEPAQGQLVLSYAKEMAQKVGSLPALVALQERVTSGQGPKLLSAGVVEKLEASWLAPNSTLAQSVLQSALSQALKSEIVGQHNFVKEVLVFDRSGALLGAAAKTTDYFQGDELKYQKTFGAGAEIFVDRLRFDESSGRFLVQVSVLVKKAGRDELAVTMGLDVSAILLAAKKSSP